MGCEDTYPYAVPPVPSTLGLHPTVALHPSAAPQCYALVLRPTTAPLCCTLVLRPSTTRTRTPYPQFPVRAVPCWVCAGHVLPRDRSVVLGWY